MLQESTSDSSQSNHDQSHVASRVTSDSTEAELTKHQVSAHNKRQLSAGLTPGARLGARLCEFENRAAQRSHKLVNKIVTVRYPLASLGRFSRRKMKMV